MNQYLSDTEYAVKNLIELASRETKKLKSLQDQYNSDKHLQRLWEAYCSSDLSEDNSDVNVQHNFIKMAQYASSKPEFQQIQTLKIGIDSHEYAIHAIAGAILQIAKQGISVVHGDLKFAPNGRLIKSVPLKDIIWQGRNQAIHFEEGSFNKQVVDLFSRLESACGKEFSLSEFTKQSRAKQVLSLLGWVEYSAYLEDMQDLLP